ncbi:MAG: hypothetical protein AAGH15_28525 [Myxococcota bacterium]
MEPSPFFAPRRAPSGLGTLGRALLRAARARTSGVVRVAGPHVGAVHLAKGRLRYVEGEGPTLGALVAARSPRALAPAVRRARKSPGEAGAALRRARIPAVLVEGALRAQHRERLRALLLREPAEVTLSEAGEGPRTLGCVDLADVVLAAARRLPAGGLSPEAALALTRLGRATLGLI